MFGFYRGSRFVKLSEPHFEQVSTFDLMSPFLLCFFFFTFSMKLFKNKAKVNLDVVKSQPS